ncbi:hypothetical protein [Methanobrevibacter sp.]
MEKNHIIIIALVVIILALVTLIGLPLITNSQNEMKVYNNVIDGVGSFNTTNMTNFTLDEDSTDGGTHYLAEDPLVEITVFSQTYLMENTISNSDRVDDSPEGHTIYKSTANVGEHKGDVRYISFLTDNDKERHIYIGSADYNLTCMIVDSFKIF